MARTYHPRGVKVAGFSVQDHPSYDTWALMLSRCYDSGATGYCNYGGRGVVVCESWHHFANFATDMGVKPGREYSIDRIDTKGNYEPSNCRWATRSEQGGNKRTYATSKTGVSGVRLRGAKYQVRIIEDGRRKSIGNYDTFEAAVSAKKARIGGAAS